VSRKKGVNSIPYTALAQFGNFWNYPNALRYWKIKKFPTTLACRCDASKRTQLPTTW